MSLDCWIRIGVHGDGSCPELREHVHCRNCTVFAAAGRALLDRPASSEYIRSCSLDVAEPKPRIERQETTVLLFRIAREWLAIDTSACSEVAAYQVPHRVPHRTGGQLLGLVSLRGTLHLVVDMASVLGIERESSGATNRQLLLLRNRETTWGVVIDQVDGVAPASLAAVGPAPTTGAAEASCIRGTLTLDGRVHGYLNEERLFAACDRCVE